MILKWEICDLCGAEDFYCGMKDFARDADHNHDVCHRDHSTKVIYDDVAQVNTKSILVDGGVLMNMNALGSDNVAETEKVVGSEEPQGQEDDEVNENGTEILVA